MSETAAAPGTPAPRSGNVALADTLSTWFFCGYFPFAPGTVGSLAGISIAWALNRFAGITGWHFLVLAAAVFPVAVWSAGVSARAHRVKDPKFVVIDEVIGQWVALAGAAALNWKSYLAAFVLFRLFDIWKPAPARQLEALPDGWGINLDDVMAGVYAALVLWGAARFNLY
jgi:phosphatidylglycerophosphatase A